MCELLWMQRRGRPNIIGRSINTCSWGKRYNYKNDYKSQGVLSNFCYSGSRHWIFTCFTFYPCWTVSSSKDFGHFSLIGVISQVLSNRITAGYCRVQDYTGDSKHCSTLTHLTLQVGMAKLHSCFPVPFSVSLNFQIPFRFQYLKCNLFLPTQSYNSSKKLVLALLLPLPQLTRPLNAYNQHCASGQFLKKRKRRLLPFLDFDCFNQSNPCKSNLLHTISAVQ